MSVEAYLTIITVQLGIICLQLAVIANLVGRRRDD